MDVTRWCGDSCVRKGRDGREERVGKGREGKEMWREGEAKI